MCLILLAVRTHPSYDLILAANRDEYYARPSLPPAFWEEADYVLGGRDLVGGGTWLGITRSGRIAAVTNYRNPAVFLKDAPSRGKLVSDFLMGKQDPAGYVERVRQEAERYNGFNLLVGDLDGLHWLSNRDDRVHRLEAGIYGISNRLLDTPWPKVVRGKKLMAAILAAEAPSHGRSVPAAPGQAATPGRNAALHRRRAGLGEGPLPDLHREPGLRDPFLHPHLHRERQARDLPGQDVHPGHGAGRWKRENSSSRLKATAPPVPRSEVPRSKVSPKKQAPVHPSN